jgi:hypothetical protein
MMNAFDYLTQHILLILVPLYVQSTCVLRPLMRIVYLWICSFKISAFNSIVLSIVVTLAHELLSQKRCA